MIKISNILDYLIAFGAITGVSIACSLFNNRGNNAFSLNTFLSCMSIGISILVWIPVVPSYLIIFSVLITTGMLFKGGLRNE